MTTKEFLQLYAATEEKLSELNERMLRLRSKAEKMTPTYEEKIGSSGTFTSAEKIPSIVEMIMDEEQRTSDYIKEIAETRKDIESAIYAVKDSKLCTLLMMRYLHGRTWEQISVMMHYSYVHVVHTLHPSALKQVKVPEKYKNM
jgi:BMFP domain-containing protein YqiC